MLDHLADLYGPLVDHVVVVVHPSFEPAIAAWAGARKGVSIVRQDDPTGMLDAVLLASPVVTERAPDAVWITWGDQIAILPSTIARLASAMDGPPAPALALPTVNTAMPYTHFARDGAGRIVRFLQRREGDAMPATGESDVGVFAMRREIFESDLHLYAEQVPRGTATGERNFVPFVAWLAARQRVVTVPCGDPREAIGVNTPDDLEQVAAWLRERGSAA
jgi:bifunctional N-acetylglucosamine-1-phosphate-uridyltransferase/glucosamine-1-phosphate-acetyltransferase GlmU-like protein